MRKVKKRYYDGATDTYWVVYKSGIEGSYVEEAPGVRVEYDKNSRVIGLEIQNYSKLFDFRSITEPREESYAFPNFGGTENIPVDYKFTSITL